MCQPKPKRWLKTLWGMVQILHEKLRGVQNYFYSSFLIKSDRYYLRKHVKICFFLKKLSLHMEWYWAWYVLGPDTKTTKTPSQICDAFVWIWKGGTEKEFSEHFFPNFHQTSLERLCNSHLSMILTYEIV